MTDTAARSAAEVAEALARSSTTITSPGPPPAAAAGEPAPFPLQRPTWVTVDRAAIRANVAALKAQAAAPRLMAVVKADGYGHGLVEVARAALAGGADWLAVALVEEGVALRAAGVEAPVLVLTEPPATAVDTLVDADLTPAVYSPAFTAAVDEAGRRRRERGGEPVRVHLKLDTGMRRVGVPQADWEDALRRVRDAEGLRLEALWSHFAVADEPDHPYIEAQAVEFRRALDLAARLGVRWDLAHLCNSAGTLTLHDEHHDMVRPGLAIYGLEPAPGLAGDTPLRPALTWHSQLALVKRLAAGEAVSYGLEWAAPRDTTVGTVPAGYADGVVRALGGRGEVVVGGARRPIVGRITMDQLVVDCGDAPVRAGDEVCLLGAQGDARVTAEDWAQWLGTITYEIVCGIGKRVPRVYVG